MIKLQFAKSIALGHALVNIFQESSLNSVIIVVADSLISPEYARWTQPVLRYVIQTIAITVSFFLHRFMVAFHSALRGGFLCSQNLVEYAVEMQWLEANDTRLSIIEISGYILAIAGLFFQLAYGFALPFPLNVFLFPFTICEKFLEYLASFQF